MRPLFLEKALPATTDTLWRIAMTPTADFWRVHCDRMAQSTFGEGLLMTWCGLRRYLRLLNRARLWRTPRFLFVGLLHPPLGLNPES